MRFHRPSQWTHRLIRVVETARTSGDPAALRLVVAGLRPSRGHDASGAVEALCDALESPGGAEAREELARALRVQVAQARVFPALVRSGIPGGESFGAELAARIGRRLLPPVPDPRDLRDRIRAVFDDPRDYVWVTQVREDAWRRLFSVLGFTAESVPGVGEELALAIRVVAHHVSSLGVSAEMTDRLPHLAGADSPFLALGRQVLRYLESFDNDVEGDEEPLLDAALATVDRCREEVERLRAEKHLHGTSLHLTSFTFRLLALLDRLDLLLHLTEPVDRDFQGSLVRLFRSLLRAEQTREHLRPHLKASADLLAHQVVEQVARKGSKYITTGRADYGRFLLSSMGGGLLVGVFALVKLVVDRWPLSLGMEAFLFGLNYALCFVLIYLTGSTLATKQPAMTANTLARSLGEGGHEMRGLEELVVRVWRSQFVSFLGNLVVAFPVALVLAWGIGSGLDSPVADPDKARSLLASLHPWRSGTVFFAGVAGVLLFVAGLLSGWVDNLLLHRDVRARVAHHPWVGRTLGARGARRFADALDRSLGVIVGNVFLGFGLGATGTVGEILGLPLDIRHIAFASAHFGAAVQALDFAVAPAVLATTALGVALIGLVNFLVSFGLSLAVALESRRVTFGETRTLVRLLLARVWSRPLDWFVPPRAGAGG